MNKFKPLLSCPFCETQAKIVENDVGLFKAECANELCSVRPSTEYKNTRHEAFKDWDTRPSYSSFEELKTVLTINEQFLSATRHLIADGTSSFNLEDELVIRKDVEKIIAEQNRRIQELELEKADALQGNRYAQLERMAINRAKKAEEEIERLKSVSTGKIPELSGVITREMVRQAMFDEWYEICMDTGHHPDDIIQLPRRGLDFSPLHWSDAVYRNISDKLGKTFQNRVQPWMTSCFGKAVANDKMERCDRFLEEALELVQAIGYSPERGHALVDYVFNRDTGQPHQEVGGVMVTLAALCLATNLDMHDAGEDELARVWTKIDKIRSKQAAKPTGSALPIAVASDKWELVETAPDDELLLLACADWYFARHGRPVPVKIGYKKDDKWTVFGASWRPTHWQRTPVPPAPQPGDI